MTKKRENLMNRRNFIASSIGGAFVLTFGLEGAKDVLASSPEMTNIVNAEKPLIPATTAQLGTWLQINADETVMILIGSSEMGQGIMTGLAQLVAEDLMVDCGRAINPDSVKAQIEGGIVHGINAALWEQIKFTAGRASVSNFNNTRKIRLSEMPQINIQLMPTNPSVSLGGVGEPGVPTVAPAIANAYFSLTGNRVRRLPFFPQ